MLPLWRVEDTEVSSRDNEAELFCARIGLREMLCQSLLGAILIFVAIFLP